MKYLLVLALLAPLSVLAVEEDKQDKMVSVMPAPQYSPPQTIAVTSEVCSGANSVGAHVLFFGFNYTVKWTDEGCTLRRNARTMSDFGDQQAAKALLCSDKKIRLAYNNAGHPCQEDIALTLKTAGAAQNAVPKAPKVVEKPKAGFIQQ